MSNEGVNEYKRFEYYKTKGLTGLKNLGNTCYMNASLQCLSHTMALTHYLMSKKFKEDISNVNERRVEYHLVLRYMDVVSNIWQENQIISPKTFKMNLEAFVKRFVGNDQHDAHECIIFMLDVLHRGLCVPVEMNIRGEIKNESDKLKRLSVEVWKNNFSKGYSYLVENFYGQTHITMKCPDCSYTSHNFDPFVCLPLNVGETNKELTLEECFMMTGKPEILDDNNKWRCGGDCKGLVNGVRESRIWKLPNILIIQLKRFDSRGRKVDPKITFDMNNMDLTKYISSAKEDKSRYKYELYAVCNHSGSENGGHYWAYCKRGNEWYNFNDTTVSAISADKVISEDNYILFFARK